MYKPRMANMTVAKDHLVPLTSRMNLWRFPHRWFNVMQFDNAFIPLMLTFGFDVCVAISGFKLQWGIRHCSTSQFTAFFAAQSTHSFP